MFGLYVKLVQVFINIDQNLVTCKVVFGLSRLLFSGRNTKKLMFSF